MTDRSNRRSDRAVFDRAGPDDRGDRGARRRGPWGQGLARESISRITGELAEWASRPLDPVYPVIFARRDSHVKVRDGQVRNTPFLS